MTCYYYCDGHRIVVFEDYWGSDADAKIWTPEHDAWVHCPGSTGIARKVFFEDDCHGLSERTRCPRCSSSSAGSSANAKANSRGCTGEGMRVVRRAGRLTLPPPWPHRG